MPKPRAAAGPDIDALTDGEVVQTPPVAVGHGGRDDERDEQRADDPVPQPHRATVEPDDAQAEQVLATLPDVAELARGAHGQA